MASLTEYIEPTDCECVAMQIRAQLAAEGFPLYGDTLYSSLADGTSPQVRHQFVCKDLFYICMTI